MIIKPQELLLSVVYVLLDESETYTMLQNFFIMLQLFFTQRACI